jgi:hypothetical protein
VMPGQAAWIETIMAWFKIERRRPLTRAGMVVTRMKGLSARLAARRSRRVLRDGRGAGSRGGKLVYSPRVWALGQPYEVVHERRRCRPLLLHTKRPVAGGVEGGH